MLEELLKRVSGLEKRLQEEKEANQARKNDNAKAITGDPTEFSDEKAFDRSAQEKRRSLSGGSKSLGEQKEPSPTVISGGGMNQGARMMSSHDHLIDTEPPPYTSLSPTPSSLISTTSRTVSSDVQPPMAKRRRTGDTQSLAVGVDQEAAPRTPFKRVR